MAEQSILVFSTFPDAETARRIARVIVEEKLAACVNIIPKIESIYHWEGKIEESSEVMALIKSTHWKYQLLEARVRIDSGHVEYLRWVEQSVIEPRKP